MMNDTEHVAFDPIFPQEPISPHHLLMGRFPSLGYAIAVVELLRTVDADSDLETMPRKEAAPFFVQECAVRLNAIEDLASRGPVLCLEFDDPPKIVDSQNSRLAAVPCKENQFYRTSLDVLDDVFLQQVVRHAKRFGLRIEILLPEVIAIAAV